MKSEYAAWLVIAAALMASGLLFGRWLVAEAPTVDPAPQPEGAAFREWFWEHRTLDLVTQVGLIFAGALGVAAILPDNEDIPPPRPDLDSHPKESP